MTNATEIKILEELQTIKCEVTGINTRLDTMGGKVDTIEGRLDTMDGKFDTIEERFDTMDGKFDIIEGRLNAIDEKLANHDTQFSSMNEILQSVRNSTTIMESEYGLKLDALFEANSANTKAHESFDKKISSIMDKMDIHSWEIDAIKTRSS